MYGFLPILILVGSYVLGSIKQINEYERKQKAVNR